MHEELRRIGLKMGLYGTGLLEDIMYGRKSCKDMTTREIKQILESWEGRNYVPIDKVEYADKVTPTITIEEVESGIYSKEEYERNYVEMICKYLETLM